MIKKEEYFKKLGITPEVPKEDKLKIIENELIELQIMIRYQSQDARNFEGLRFNQNHVKDLQKLVKELKAESIKNDL